MVRCRISRSQVRRSINANCCSGLFTGTNRSSAA
jgi:hypothetical protein